MLTSVTRQDVRWRIRLATLPAAIVVALLTPFASAAQDAAGLVRGRVTASGAPLAGVRIVAQSPQLTLAREVVSSSDGTYALPQLPAGEYVISFTRDTFVAVKHVTRLSALESIVVDVSMVAAADHQELISVSIQTQPFPEPPASVDVMRQARPEFLPVEGGLFSVITRAPGPVNTSHSSVALDGVPIHFLRTGRDRPLLNPGAAGITDATVMMSGVPAEITHLQSGAVSLVPARGGDRFSGVVNATLANADRSADAVAEARNTRAMGGGVDFGVGVPLNGRRTWIYGTGVQSIERFETQAHLSNALFDGRFDESLWTVTASHAFNPRHRVRANLVRGNRRVFAGLPLGAASIEEATAADDRANTHGLLSAAYDGALGGSTYLSAQIASERWRGETRDRLTDTMPALWDRQTGAVGGAAGACLGCELDNRTNVEGSAALRRPFVIAGDQHLVTVGGAQAAGGFDPAEAGLNSLDLLSSRFVVSNGQVSPVFEPNGSSWIVRGNGVPGRLTHGSQGIFLSDEWRRGASLTIRAGLRWDRQKLQRDDVAANGDSELVRTGVSPRLHVAWQPRPNGFTVVGGFARYEADILHVAGERLAPAGDWFLYTGGPIVPSPSATPRFTNLDATWAALVQRSASVLAPTTEWTIGTSAMPKPGLTLRTDFIWQRSRPLGLDDNPAVLGPVDLTALSFDRPGAVDLGLLARRYTALVMQAYYDLGVQASIGARYTLSKLSGELDNRAAASPVASWSSPSGDLSNDRRHRLSFWSQVAVIDTEEQGTLGLALIETIESGAPYGVVSWIDAAPAIGSSTPVLMPYYFTARDAFRTEGSMRTDFSVRYVRRLPGTVRTDLLIQFHALNLFDAEQVLDRPSYEAARTAFSHPSAFAPFNPFTQQPVRNVHWDVDPRLTSALATAQETMPRAYRLTVGIRF